MRYSTSGGVYTAPPPLLADRLVTDQIHQEQLIADSGESAMLVPDDPIKLQTLIVTWQGVTTPGELHIGPFTFLQGEGAGQLVIPCQGLQTTGLRTANTSYGGKYSVVVIYQEDSSGSPGIGSDT